MVGQLGPVWVRVSQNAAPVEAAAREASVAAVVARVVYAAFGMRLIAFVIDSVILGVVFAVIVSIYPTQLMIVPEVSAQNRLALPELTGLGLIVVPGLMWIYYTLFEGSAWQATPGKRLLGIYVTDLVARPLTLSRASFRSLGRLVSCFTLYLGFIAALFTPRKQALHDLLAGSLVLRRPPRA
jgi:uncharacterized RDD family membrane protein YckC